MQLTSGDFSLFPSTMFWPVQAFPRGEYCVVEVLFGGSFIFEGETAPLKNSYAVVVPLQMRSWSAFGSGSRYCAHFVASLDPRRMDGFSRGKEEWL